VTLEPSDRIVGEILAEVIPLFRRFRGQHAGRVAHQVIDDARVGEHIAVV
jgi:hypothetical protein